MRSSARKRFVCGSHARTRVRTLRTSSADTDDVRGRSAKTAQECASPLNSTVGTADAEVSTTPPQTSSKDNDHEIRNRHAAYLLRRQRAHLSADAWRLCRIARYACGFCRGVRCGGSLSGTPFASCQRFNRSLDDYKASFVNAAG